MRQLIAALGFCALLFGVKFVRADAASDAQAVFTVRCTECHGEKVPRPRAGFGYVTDLKRLAANKDLIVPGDPKESVLWQMVNDGEMPPKGAKNGGPTDDEKKAIRVWIESLKPAADSQPATQKAAMEGEGFFTKALRLLGRTHVVSVHFPIALVLAAGTIEATALLRKRRPDAVRVILWMGATGAIAACLLGALHAYEDGFLARGGKPFWIHAALGLAATIIAVAAALLYERRFHGGGSRISARVALGLAMVLVGATGHFGGMLVYGPDYFSW